jgi:heme-degrading monooxygenase HmoA
LESIKKWKADLDHQKAQIKGQKIWYQQYKIRIAKVERDYEFFKK